MHRQRSVRYQLRSLCSRRLSYDQDVRITAIQYRDQAEDEGVRVVVVHPLIEEPLTDVPLIKAPHMAVQRSRDMVLKDQTLEAPVHETIPLVKPVPLCRARLQSA